MIFPVNEGFMKHSDCRICRPGSKSKKALEDLIAYSKDIHKILKGNALDLTRVRRILINCDYRNRIGLYLPLTFPKEEELSPAIARKDDLPTLNALIDLNLIYKVPTLPDPLYEIVRLTSLGKDLIDSLGWYDITHTIIIRKSPL